MAETTLAKLEAQHWLTQCRTDLEEFPGVMRCLEEVLVATGSATVTFELARVAAFKYVEQTTGLSPLEQAKHPELEHVRMGLQSALSVYGAFWFTWQVFSFDADIAHELTKVSQVSLSDVEGQPLPVDILERMPYTSFVLVPNLPTGPRSILVRRHDELPGNPAALEMLTEGKPAAFVELVPGRSLRQSMDGLFEKAAAVPQASSVLSRERSEQVVGLALPLVLYLCAENREVSGDVSPPLLAKKTKRGPRIFAPDKPFVAEVGVRVGAALRAHRSTAAQEATDGAGTGTKKTPHLRSSHWHTYWTGPRADIASRKRILHFLPPIAVNLTPGTAPTAVIRPVSS